MLTSLGLIFLLGLLMAAICQKIHLPRIIGMLFTGIILGPYVLNLLDGCIDSEYFITAATDRADHYTSQGRIISGSEGFEKSRTFRSHAVLRSRYL